MYVLTVKDGLVTRYIGPYSTPQKASDDLDRVLLDCTDRARWQIHALEPTLEASFSERFSRRRDSQISVAAS